MLFECLKCLVNGQELQDPDPGEVGLLLQRSCENKGNHFVQMGKPKDIMKQDEMREAIDR